jgi:hypothetical protein
LLFLEWKAIGAVCFHKSLPAALFLRSFMAFFLVRWITPGLHDDTQHISYTASVGFQHFTASSCMLKVQYGRRTPGSSLAPGDHFDLAAALRFMVLDSCYVCICLCLCCLRLPGVNIHASCLLLILRHETTFQ